MDLENYFKTLQQYAADNKIPIIRQESAKVLVDFIKKVQPNEILEIGTAIGYSGSLMLSNCNANLTTIELNENSFLIAKQNFKLLNLTNRTTLYLDDAYNAIIKLQSLNKKFDLIFLDGPKGQYVKYLPILKTLLVKNGVLVADNILFRGMVYSKEIIPHKYRTIVVNLRKFLIDLQADNNFSTKILKVEDGLLMSKKIKE